MTGVRALHERVAAASGARTSVVATLLLTACTLWLTRHTQVPGATALLVPVVLATVLIGVRLGGDSAVLVPAFVWLALSAVAALLNGTDPVDVARFSAIVVGVLLATQAELGRVAVRWVLAPLWLQAVGIAALAVVLGVLQDPETALFVRAYVIDAEWGDVYTQNDWQYRVQLIGNALLPLAFMLTLQAWRRGRMHVLMPLVFALGVLAAGNLTYAIFCGAYAYLVLVGALSKRARYGVVLLSLAAAVALSGLAQDILSEKSDGSDSSLGVRFDQVDVLVDAYAEAPVAALFGHGVGARYPDGRQRPYSQYQYIELQILYFAYQFGIVGTLLLFGTLVAALRSRMAAPGRTIFWLYIGCGITNPYILDTNQMVATVLLLSLFPRARRIG